VSDDGGFGSGGADRRQWREILKNVNLEAQLNAAGAPPWVGEMLKKVASLSADAASSAGEKIGKTLNTVQTPLNMSKDILRESLEGLLDSYTLEVSAKINFKRKDNVTGDKGEKNE